MTDLDNNRLGQRLRALYQTHTSSSANKDQHRGPATSSIVPGVLILYLCTAVAAVSATTNFMSVVQLPLELQSHTLKIQPNGPTLDSASYNLWAGNLGDGFRKGAIESGASLGFGLGSEILGSKTSHDFVLSKIHLGRMISGVLGEDRWYRGNVELVGELFGGGQIKPESAYVAGVTTLLRHNFATGCRFIPFVEGGAGITLTDVGLPDLSTTFEFNTQGGVGVSWFFSPRFAATMECRFVHYSNADIKRPNLGVNFTVFYAGITRFF